MLSRVAENVYWMARYVERAENIARVMDVNNHLALDMPNAGSAQWLPLIAIMSDEEPFFKKHTVADRDSVIDFMACDADNPNSIISCLKSARENARSIRELIPSDAWVQLNTLYLRVTAAAESGHCAFTPDVLNEVRLGSHLFFGLLADIMTRDEGYYFAQLGRFIERADKTSRVIDVKYFLLLPSPSDVGSPLDNIQWAAMLKSVSAYEMFRKRSPAIDPPRVVDFLLKDETFPGSVIFCLRAIRYFLIKIAPTEEQVAAFHVDRLADEIAAAPAEKIILKGLHESMDALQTALNALHEEIHDQFFARKATGYSRILPRLDAIRMTEE